jgi:hypothetical protein
MARAIILTHIHVKAEATPPEEYLARVVQKWSDEEREDFIGGTKALFTTQEERIRAAGLWENMDDDERVFIQTEALETTTRQRINASWVIESIGCLLWAVGRLDKIPRYDEESGKRVIAFRSGECAKDLIEQARLRPTSEIDRQRDWAELWHWRCRTRMLLETKKILPPLPKGKTMAEVIRMTAAKAEREGAFYSAIGEDFPTFGKPFREMTEDEFTSVTSIATERHKALNWLCGYAPCNRWAETSTDT